MLQKKYKIIALVGKSGSGKAQPNSTIIPTPNGYKKIGELQVGEYVFDKHGQLTKILQIFPQGKLPVYKITFSDGRFSYCNDEHLWSCFTSKGNLKQFTVAEMLSLGLRINRGYKFKIPICEPVNYIEKNFLIDPYIIGCLLGDGNNCSNENKLKISSETNEIPMLMAKEFIYDVIPEKISPSDKCYNWKFKIQNQNDLNNIITKYNKRKDLLSLPKDILEHLKPYICTSSDNKNIPPEYLFGNIKQRYSLLQGLLDTDGTIDNKGRIRFTSISLPLITSVRELCHSLGMLCNITIDKRTTKYRNGNVCYNLIIQCKPEIKEDLFRLTRKKQKAREYCLKSLTKKTTQKKDKISIVEIKNCSYQEEMTCIMVDNKEQLYLTNNYIVTHNTHIANKFIENNDYHMIVSCTTRPPREGEIEGKDYHFISIEEFAAARFLESSSFNGWYYGTRYEDLDPDRINIGVFNPTGIKTLAAKEDVELKIIEVQASDKTRLLRQLNREECPNVKEIVRRFYTDEEDFNHFNIEDYTSHNISCCYYWNDEDNND